VGADPIAILDQARRAALSLATRANAETLKRILAAAQTELNARLAKVDAAATDTFSVRQMQVTLREIEAILDIVKKKLLLHTLEASKASAKGAIGATAKYLSAAEQQFAGIGGAGLGLNTAAVFERAISGTETSVLRRLTSDPTLPGHQGVMDRYGEAVVGKFEERLQIGMVAGTPWEEVRKQLVEESPFLQGAPAHWAERIVRTETLHAHNRAGYEATKEIDRQTGGMMIRILCATFDNRTAADSYAVHGQIRRMDEPFQSWFGSYMTPPNRPNDREIVVPHMIEWPIPAELKPKSNGEVAARWAWEGRKGSPPARPLMSTVPLKEIGKPVEVEAKPPELLEPMSDRSDMGSPAGA